MAGRLSSRVTCFEVENTAEVDCMREGMGRQRLEGVNGAAAPHLKQGAGDLHAGTGGLNCMPVNPSRGDGGACAERWCSAQQSSNAQNWKQ